MSLPLKRKMVKLSSFVIIREWHFNTIECSVIMVNIKDLFWRFKRHNYKLSYLIHSRHGDFMVEYVQRAKRSCL